jgi:hypothetical protein
MHRSKKPKLVTQYLENISSEGFEKHADVIRKFVRGRIGIYALYRRRGKLYYAGLASDLRNRLNSHLRDRHKKRWETFSVYLTIGDEHLRELESLILRIVQPPGNEQLGKFSGAENLNRKFAREIARKQRAERDRILGKESTSEEIDHGPRKSRRIRGKFKGKFVKGRLRSDNRVRYKGKLYGSPSAAASALKKRAMNGWLFWHYERGPGDWVPIDELRRG